MTDRQGKPATHRSARTGDGPARTLRDNLAAIQAHGASGVNQARFQFRCLKRLYLPRHDLAEANRL